ncbi:MAG: alpha/beta fold hydrolase, partial [Alphaproteobacteria bacterium]
MPRPRSHKGLRAVLCAAALGLALAACAPTVQPAGPGPTGRERLAGGGGVLRFEATDGTVLPMRRWLPEGPPRAVILSLHGFGDTGNSVLMPAPRFTAGGVALYAYDQRGFGAAPNHGRWPGMERLVADARDAIALLRARYPDTPLFAMGESMGATVLLVALTGPEAPDVDGAILLAPAVWSAERMPWLYRATLALAAH